MSISIVMVIGYFLAACGASPTAAPAEPVQEEAATTEEPAAEADPAEAVSEEEVTLTFVFWEWGPDARLEWEGISEGFTKENPHIKVELLAVQGPNWGSYLEGVATLIAGGEHPDIMLVATEGVQFLVQQDLILPLDDFIAQDQAEVDDFKDDIAPVMYNAFNVDGKQYMFPYAWNNMVIYYNTDRLAEAGLEPPSADWTRDEFLEMAKALTVDEDGDGTPEKYGYAWSNGELFPSAMPWIFANNSNILTDDYCSVQVTDPDVIEALQFMHDLLYVHKVAPEPIGFGDLFNLFQTGDVAMFGAGRWPLTTLVPAGFEAFNIQYWPGNPQRKTEFGIAGFPILQVSEHPEAAWKLVKHLTRVDVQEKMIGTEDSLPSNIPARRSVAAQMENFPPENAEVFYSALDDNAELVPAPVRFNEMESIFLRYTSLIFADEMGVEEAMAAAQAELESVVSCN
ncbi:MAG: sugar ABC transporter substrate-binding protein [Anaerolineae bacterium]|nr:sugar ABC transporter substrate-binding protein [Anaerolineae bacterium]